MRPSVKTKRRTMRPSTPVCSKFCGPVLSSSKARRYRLHVSSSGGVGFVSVLVLGLVRISAPGNDVTAHRRRLVLYLDERLLYFKKRLAPLLCYNYGSRNDPANSLYLSSQERPRTYPPNPPVDPSTSLPIAHLLRLTGDVLCSIPGYTFSLSILQNLADFLNMIRPGWSCFNLNCRIPTAHRRALIS
jgi:hypothetical protein